MDRNKINGITLIIVGLGIGISLFIAGEADDAPGLCLLGFIIAFLSITNAFYYIGLISKRKVKPVIAFTLAIIGLALPVILTLDGEIAYLSLTTIISSLIGLIFLILGIISLKKQG